MRARVALLLLSAVACGPSAPPPSETPAAPSRLPPPTTLAAPTPAPEAPPSPSEPPPPTLVASDAVPDDDAHRCVRDEDCVLVTGMCGGIVAAHRDHAERLQQDIDALASVGECARAIPQDPVDPTCAAHLCTTTPALDADARTCRRNGDCEAIAETCRWLVGSRTAPGYPRLQARAEAARVGPAPPCTMSPPPAVECRYHFCSASSALLPARHR